MKEIKIESVHQVAGRIADVLGIPAERTQRIILDVDVTKPVAVIYVQMIGDTEAIDAICDLIGPYYTTAGAETAKE